MRYRELVATFGTAARAFDAAPGLRGHPIALDDADRALDRAERCGAHLLLLESAEYPGALRDLEYPPPALFALGDLDRLRPPVVAIVGTRRATAYGERVTRDLAGALAAAGATIVSGLARGIDAAAHRAALTAGSTVAVLGTGVDITYPAAHRGLQDEIAARGVLLSEELPGDRASGGSFPKRNRIIAALASVTIIVEAPVRSGALITASHALDLGRTVAAVPGPIDAPQSAGSNELLRDGAMVIATVDDALALIGAAPAPVRTLPVMDAVQRLVWGALADGMASVEMIAARTGQSIRDCLAAVTALEVEGLLECTTSGEICRTIRSRLDACDPPTAHG